MEIEQIKKLFAKGTQYVKNMPKSVLFSSENKFLDTTLALAERTNNLTTLMSAIWLNLYSSYWETSFKSPESVDSSEILQKTGIQFGYGMQGWYFFYGIAGDITFNLSFFRTEIAPPKVVREFGLEPSEAVGWLIQGGYGKGDVWHQIPYEYILMKYDQQTSTTFNLEGKGSNISASLSSKTPMTFEIKVNWVGPTGPHELEAQLSARSPPSPNYPGVCECGFGLGSWYYSYTDLDLVLSTDGIVGAGRAWVDHQLIKAGIPNSLYIQALQVLTDTKKSPGWLWFAVQDFEDDTQYMFSKHYGDKIYKDAIHKGDEFSPETVNVYKAGKLYWNPKESGMDSSDAKIKVQEMINIPNLQIDLPSRYDMVLPGGKKVFLTIASAPNVYTSPFAAYETPAILSTPTGKIIGQGLIEANFYLDNDTLALRYTIAAGGGENEYKIISSQVSRKHTSWQKLLALMIVVFPLILLLFAIGFIFYRKDKRKERVMISLATALIIYAFYSMIK